MTPLPIDPHGHYEGWIFDTALFILALVVLGAIIGLVKKLLGFARPGKNDTNVMTGRAIPLPPSPSTASHQPKREFSSTVSGAPVDSFRQSGAYGIFAAIERDDYVSVTEIAKRGEMLVAVDEIGATPLHRAAAKGNAQVVRLLLQHGADPNASDNYGEIAIRRAMRCGDVDTVEVFLSAGVGINGKRSTKGQLFDVGVNINEKDADREDGFGETLLHIAVGEGNIALAKHLLVHGADPHVTDDCGNTVVMAAVSRGDTELARLFLDLGVDVNAANSDEGRTALHLAAEHGDRVMIALLLEHGARINAEDEMGDTPLADAKLCKHAEAIELLRKHGGVDTNQEKEADDE